MYLPGLTEPREMLSEGRAAGLMRPAVATEADVNSLKGVDTDCNGKTVYLGSFHALTQGFAEGIEIVNSIVRSDQNHGESNE